MKKLVSMIVMFIVIVLASAATVSAFCDEGQMFPHPEDCNKFIKCHNGEAVELTCPAMLHFNPTTQTCDWPESAGCSSGGGTKQCYKNPNDSKNDGNCSLRQDSDGSGAYIMECRTASWSKPSPCETGVSI
ncbi:carbohydrate-binding module family 14 protein [Chitinophaga solisilvae]|uniref:carbohydrate-binding module family 14 protein n=1 Tax=Chitinophaga solisilvae TaxID=1233460 RepID=UPI00136AA96D|nr:carbohydrate-binding module family 14 protein [Chitinophaga solisilvae]